MKENAHWDFISLFFFLSFYLSDEYVIHECDSHNSTQPSVVSFAAVICFDLVVCTTVTMVTKRKTLNSSNCNAFVINYSVVLLLVHDYEYLWQSYFLQQHTFFCPRSFLLLLLLIWWLSAAVVFLILLYLNTIWHINMELTMTVPMPCRVLIYYKKKKYANIFATIYSCNANTLASTHSHSFACSMYAISIHLI